LQHLNPDAQLDVKQNALLQALERIGGLLPEVTLPALAGQPFGYRRRARLGAKLVDKKGRVLVDFVKNANRTLLICAAAKHSTRVWAN
jgi:23S rRNA (uracil1939-C5)-methyltransferase